MGFVTFDKKLNVSAILALLVAAATGVVHLRDYWIGASTSLDPPDLVYLVTDGKFLRVGARMTYSNRGREGANALVLKERVRISFAKFEYRQWAEHRGRFDLLDGLPHLFDPADAAPFIVPGGKLVTHDSFFAARVRHAARNPHMDWISPSELAQQLSAAQRDTQGPHLKVTFQAQVRQLAGLFSGEQRTLSVECQIPIDKGLIDRLNNEGWTSRSCREATSWPDS